MAILFYSSSQTYEEQSQIGLLSKLLANEPLKNYLNRISFNYGGSEVSIAAKGYFAFVEFFVRKFAHFFTFFLLGGSLFIGIKPLLKNSWLTLFLSWMGATGYAAFDEFHQMLTGDRTPLIQDVMLDSCGALTACLICLIYFETKKTKKILKSRR